MAFLNRKIDILAYQLLEFVQTGHQHANLVKSAISAKLEHIVTSTTLKFVSQLTTRTRHATPKSAEIQLIWPFDWATDKTAFRRDLKRFERNFPDLREGSTDLIDTSADQTEPSQRTPTKLSTLLSRSPVIPGAFQQSIELSSNQQCSYRFEIGFVTLALNKYMWTAIPTW